MPYLVHVNIPRVKGSKSSLLDSVIRHLKQRGVKVQNMRAHNSHALLFRLHASSLNSILAELQDLGVGVNAGHINIVNVEATIPDVLPLRDDVVGLAGSSLPVEVVAYNIAQGAALNFDMVLNIIIASVISAVGLATNSPVTVVASMLVSPLMGSILGFTFATIARDRKLAIRSIYSHAIGVFLTWLMGALIVIPWAPFGEAYEFPTGQMDSRGQYAALLEGFAVALPSGFGVALAVVGNQVNSLVGVAISAALLPPIVNSGMCFVYAFLAPVFHDFVDRDYFLRISAVSFALFLVNLFTIYLSALLMFKIKSLAPTNTKSPFWTDQPVSTSKFTSTNALNFGGNFGGLKSSMSLAGFAQVTNVPMGMLNSQAGRSTSEVVTAGGSAV